jgi:hypothetical protein
MFAFLSSIAALFLTLASPVSVPQARIRVVSQAQTPKVSVLMSPDVSQPHGHERFLLVSFAAQGDFFQGIVSDPSGQYVWLADEAHNALVRVAMDFSTQSFSLSTPSGPFTPGYFTFASDGSIYVGGCVVKKCSLIGHLSADLKQFAVLPIPSGDGPGTANQLVLAPASGDVWFIEISHVAKIDKSGAITEYPIDIPVGGPNIVVGADGRIWYDGIYYGSYIGYPKAGYIDPKTGRSKTTFLHFTGSNPQEFRGLGGGMALDRNGKVAVLVRYLGDSFLQYYIDEVDARFNQTIIPVNQSLGVGTASLIPGPNARLWWGTPSCPFGSSSNSVPCAMATYDSKANRLEGVPWPRHRDVSGANLAWAGDGNVWGVCCGGNLSSGTPNSLLIRLVNSLSVKPRRITLGAPGDSAPLEARYTGRSKLSATSQNVGVATVTQTSERKFLVTAAGKGSTTIVVQDQLGNSFKVAVTVH